jgi:hypothetical protein
MATQTKEALNEYAIKKIKYLTEHKYFEIIKTSDHAISQNDDPLDRSFYLSEQDKLSEAFGEIIIAYYRLKAKLKTYIAVRKFEMKISAKTKLPGNEILEDLIKSEIPELYNATLILEGWMERAENSIRTTRSHTYGENKDRENKKEREN